MGITQDAYEYDSQVLVGRARRVPPVTGALSVADRFTPIFAYPDCKFDRLRNEAPGAYETCPDVGLDEWITMRVEFHGRKASLYLIDKQHAAFIVNEMKGTC
jgi:hypothetical protein